MLSLFSIAAAFAVAFFVIWWYSTRREQPEQMETGPKYDRELNKFYYDIIPEDESCSHKSEQSAR